MAEEAASPPETPDPDPLVMYRTKRIQFLGRSTPIVLQNDNGPCPLLAICNVLLLRNAIQLDTDAYEVSQDRLLHLVADRLLESNYNVKSKDEVYLSNQQQNISDAIDLLPRLATGIDVNVLFRKINDFEFTRECAIFDLLDIGLYHGWIIAPEDEETAAAIGSKSYNTLVGELVSLESSNHVNEMNLPVEDTVDFAAAKAATLGIPHPSLSTCRSFENQEDICQIVVRKGDLEEEAELMKALQLSTNSLSEPVSESSNEANTLTEMNMDEGKHLETPLIPETLAIVEKEKESHDSQMSEQSPLQPQEAESQNFQFDSAASAYSGDIVDVGMKYSSNATSGCFDKMIFEKVKESASSEAVGSEVFAEKSVVSLITKESAACDEHENELNETQDSCISENSFKLAENAVSDLATCSGSATGSEQSKISQDASSCLEDTEPIYEGEDYIIDSPYANYENGEPVYEGESVLTEQNTSHIDAKKEILEEHQNGSSKITLREGLLIRDFLKDSASQLTIYGLFCLQEGLKDRELCVFFRNNHFSTLFKSKNELYILATDQGYINQPDLVWEKLNEVNGDTMFMTGDFKEFKVDNQVNENWSQQNTMAVTSDYLSTVNAAKEEGTTMSSDLQLAIALQEQEYDQQKQCQPPQPQSSQQPSSDSRRSRLIVGPPQMPRPEPAVERPDAKKDKCILM